MLRDYVQVILLIGLMAVFCGCSQQEEVNRPPETASGIPVSEPVERVEDYPEEDADDFYLPEHGMSVIVSDSGQMQFGGPVQEDFDEAEFSEEELEFEEEFPEEFPEEFYDDPIEEDLYDEDLLEIAPEEEGETIAVEESPAKMGMLRKPEYTDFVDVTHYIPDIYVDLKYATEDNFTNQCIYGFGEAFLRYGTVEKLHKVCQELAEKELYLKIWDAYRPASAQFRLWELCPDSRYVADPNKGYSNHTRGNAVDVTLVDAWGRELAMPTGFDDFTDAANRSYTGCTEEARQNAMLLEYVMEKHGFQGYWGEWWHFSDSMKYEPETVFDPQVLSTWYPDCNEFISLRERPSGYADVVDRIYLGSPFTVMGYSGQFAMAEYLGQRGYVLTKYIRREP